jgi:hypothetical protein
MAVLLQIENADTPDAVLQQEAMLLGRLLAAQPELVVAYPDAAPIAPGERGGALQLGRLLLSFIAPEGIEVLVDGLKLYVERSPEYSIAVTNEGGAKIEITARNLTPERVVETAGQLRTLLAARP